MTVLIATSIDDLTDDQVLALNDDEIDMLIKRRMAEEGIPILPMPIEPEYLDVPGPEVAVYEVAGIAFNDRGAAEDVLQVVNRHASARVRTDYDYSVDYNRRYVKSDDDSEMSVVTKMYYSAEIYAIQKKVFEENAKRKERYRQEKSTYSSAEDKAKSIHVAVHGRIDDVQRKAERTAMLADRFIEYRSIAQGDDLMAMRFLVKAFDLADEEIADVRRHLGSVAESVTA